MTGRFLSPRDMSAARHTSEVYNSMVNRGEIKTEEVARLNHVVCGCGVEGCIFLHKQKHTVK
jgi:hypothetical protein